MKQLQLDSCSRWTTDQISSFTYHRRKAKEHPQQAQLSLDREELGSEDIDDQANRLVLVKGGSNFPRPPRHSRKWPKKASQLRLGPSSDSGRLVIIRPPCPQPIKRQAQLGRSAINRLIRAPAKLSQEPPSEYSSIVSLPNELLINIFHWIAQHEGLNIAALSAVCRRFHHLAAPLLYKSLEIKIGWWEKDEDDHDNDNNIGYYIPVMTPKSSLRLYRTLRHNPALRQHCRELRLSLQNPTYLGCLGLSHAVDILSWLEKVARLRLRRTQFGAHHGYSEGETWALIRAVAQHTRSSLRELHLGPGLGLHLIEVCHLLADLPNLESLHLDDVQQMAHVLPQNPWKGVPRPLNRLSLTSLSLAHYHDSAANLRRFLLFLPARLMHFSFMGSTDTDSEHHSTLTFQFLVSVLSPHSGTLYTLSISTSYILNSEPTDLREFECLTELSLSLLTTAVFPNPNSFTWAALTVPNIRKFRWLISDIHHQDLSGFWRTEEDWVRSLARLAINQGSSLREIEVEWQVTSENFWPRGKPEIYPWDRLEGLRRELLHEGIQLSWSSPSIPIDALKRQEDGQGW